MNLSTPLAIYAALSKELSGELIWPGSVKFYTAATCFTSSKIHADFCLWAAKEPKASNEAFNVTNGDTESWQNLWPKLAKRFGCTVAADQLARKLDEKLESKSQLSPKPAIADQAAALGLEGSAVLEPSYVESRIDVIKWSQQDEVKSAWNKLADKHGLQKELLEKTTWWFLQFELGRNFDLWGSMSKARKLGWTGYVDTWDSFEDVFQELESAGVIPKQGT